jgi:hypothetical protein
MPGQAWLGKAWPGKARQARPGAARPGKARQGRRGVAWRGMAGQGKAGIQINGTGAAMTSSINIPMYAPPPMTQEQMDEFARQYQLDAINETKDDEPAEDLG